MSRWYRFLYGIGLTPWDSGSEDVAEQLEPLMAVEEAGRPSPFGRALDLGCGTGRWSVALAQRGWEVVGVDVVPKAIRAARRRADVAGADIAFHEGDVTALTDAGLHRDFSFFLDVECFNHLGEPQRAAMGEQVTALAGPDATMLLLAWTRARRGPLPPGASDDDVQSAFAGWQIVDQHPYTGLLPGPLKRAAPRWIRLARS